MGGQRLTAGKQLNQSILKTRELNSEITRLKNKLTSEEKEEVIEFMEKLLSIGRS